MLLNVMLSMRAHEHLADDDPLTPLVLSCFGESAEALQPTV